MASLIFDYLHSQRHLPQQVVADLQPKWCRDSHLRHSLLQLAPSALCSIWSEAPLVPWGNWKPQIIINNNTSVFLQSWISETIWLSSSGVEEGTWKIVRVDKDIPLTWYRWKQECHSEVLCHGTSTTTDCSLRQMVLITVLKCCVENLCLFESSDMCEASGCIYFIWIR